MENIREAQLRLLEKRKAIKNPTQSILRDEGVVEIKEIVERIKVKQMKNVAVDFEEKPSYMSDVEWKEENKVEIEDDEYNARRVLTFLGISGVPEKYKDTSFDTFIGNDKIKKNCQLLADSKNDILISGPTGSGKTHLAIAIMRHIGEMGVLKYPMGRNERGKILWEPGVLGRRKTALFITTPRLLMDLRSVFGGNKKIDKYDRYETKTEEDAIEEYTGLELLVLDDLGAEKTTDYSLTSLYMIIDERINNLKRTIITTNLSLKEIEEKMDARVASRLAGMKIINLNMPDYRKKR